MTRTYALKRLLEHGPMTTDEIIEVTGWGKNATVYSLKHLRRYGLIRKAVLFNGWVACV